MAERLTLKWGTLKGWELDKDGPAYEMMRRYVETDVTLSAMAQRDDLGQKVMICDIIDALDGTIFNDWSGEYMDKESAKTYIMDY